MNKKLCLLYKQSKNWKRYLYVISKRKSGDKMSKANVFYMCLAALTLSSVIIITSIAYDARGENANAEVMISETPETTDESIGYILKEYEGKLALFRENSTKPYKKLEVDISTLTDLDKELVRQGIVVKTEKELNALLEDYTS
jgi:hypothetical protein